MPEQINILSYFTVGNVGNLSGFCHLEAPQKPRPRCLSWPRECFFFCCLQADNKSNLFFTENLVLRGSSSSSCSKVDGTGESDYQLHGLRAHVQTHVPRSDSWPPQPLHTRLVYPQPHPATFFISSFKMYPNNISMYYVFIKRLIILMCS